MAGTISRIRPRLPAEVDAMLDECIAQAKLEGHVVTVYMRLDPPRNKPCPFCDSGKKWKRCACREEDTYTLTFWPEGYRRPRRPSRMSHAALGYMVGAWIGNLH